MHKIPGEQLSEALNYLDKVLGEHLGALEFSIDEEKESVKLWAKCKKCPKEIEVRLWYRHEQWPEHMVKDFIRDAVLHEKVHKPQILMPGGKSYWKGKQ